MSQWSDCGINFWGSRATFIGCGAVQVGTCPLQVPENRMNSLSVQPHLPQRSQNPFQGTETVAASCTLAADRPCKCFRTTFLYAFQGEHETSMVLTAAEFHNVSQI